MYFDLQSRRFETPTVESAMSWRERALLSLFIHLLFALLVILGPRLQFVQDAMERRAEELAEMAEAEGLALRQAPDDDAPAFIFVDTLVDPPASASPLAADLSDQDRVAQSPTQAEDPLNDLPNAEGNSFEFVQTPDPADGLDPLTSPGQDAQAMEAAPAEPVDGVDDGMADAPESDAPEADPEAGEGETAPRLAERGASGRRPIGDRPGTILNRALRGLDTVARNRTFYNLRGRTDRYGPDIQFDSKGVDFGSWLRRFRAQIYRNWFIPYAAMSMSGNVVLTFNVHMDGTLTDLTVERPSTVDAFTSSAFNAIRGSNPTYPLPPEYPDDQVFFTVTFYFNERQPGG